MIEARTWPRGRAEERLAKVKAEKQNVKRKAEARGAFNCNSPRIKWPDTTQLAWFLSKDLRICTQREILFPCVTENLVSWWALLFSEQLGLWNAFKWGQDPWLVILFKRRDFCSRVYLKTLNTTEVTCPRRQGRRSGKSTEIQMKPMQHSKTSCVPPKLPSNSPQHCQNNCCCFAVSSRVIECVYQPPLRTSCERDEKPCWCFPPGFNPPLFWPDWMPCQFILPSEPPADTTQSQSCTSAAQQLRHPPHLPSLLSALPTSL